MRRSVGATAAVLAAVVVGATSTATAPYEWSPFPDDGFLAVHPEATPRPAPTATPPRPERHLVRQLVPAPTPRVARPVGALSGQASWYCNNDPHRGQVSRCVVGHPGGMYAAVRPDLLGHRGDRARVCLAGRKTSCVVVTVIDCNCGRHANLVDLYADAFESLAGSLGPGRVDVVLGWL